MEHDAQCVRCADERGSLIAAYAETWPRHCQRCKGRGAFGHTDMQTGFPDVELCPVCAETGTCARCGEQGLTSEDRGDDSTGDGPCKACGWNYDDAAPPPWECECWNVEPIDALDKGAKP